MPKMNEYKLFDISDEKDFAEVMRTVHHSVVTSGNRNIHDGDSNVYRTSQAAFIAAIATAYPELPSEDIYEGWVDNQESIAYNANVVKQHQKEDSEMLVDRLIDRISSISGIYK